MRPFFSKFISVAVVGFVLTGLSGAVLLAHAQGAPCTNSFKGGIDCVDNNVVTGSGLAGANVTATGILTTIILWLMEIAAVLALAAIVWGGITYIISFGNEKKAEESKKVILYAIVGLIIIGLSFLIITTIKTIIA